MRNESRWPLVVIGSALVLGALLAFDFSGPVRVVAALWFLLACPGMAFIPLLGAVLDTLVATAHPAAGARSGTRTAPYSTAVSILGCALQLLPPTATQV